MLYFSKRTFYSTLRKRCLNVPKIEFVFYFVHLNNMDIPVNWIDFLKIVTGKCQCLVQLSTLPVAVCYGCGITSKDAQASAAQNALEYLKIMTKKWASALLLPAITVARIIDRKLPPKSIEKENSNVDVHGKLTISQVLEKSKIVHKSSSSDHAGTKKKVLKNQTKNIDAIRTDHRNSLSSTGSNNLHLVKRNVKSLVTDQSAAKIIGNVRSNHGNVRPVKSQYENCSKDHHHHHHQQHHQGGRKYSNEFEAKAKNYSANTETYGKGGNANYQDYKPRNNDNNGGNSNLPQLKYSNQSTTAQQQIFQRDCNNLPSTSSSKLSSRSETMTLASGATTAHSKVLEQHNLVPKMGQINFPPLRAPQSIVNVRHPFLTEARLKQQQSADIGVVNVSKQKSSVASTLQNSISELEHNRQTYHGYSSSPITNIPNVQNLANITSIAQYPRPDSFPQQTLASVLFPESSQFPQSPPYATPQVGQINQFQAYDPASFTPTPVNINSVIPQFSAESSLSYPQFDNTPQFMQTNHYPTADMANGQYQYQAAGVGQIPDSPLFIQSLQSPLTVADQYAAPNYAQAVRTELMPRLRRPPRFNK